MTRLAFNPFPVRRIRVSPIKINDNGRKKNVDIYLNKITKLATKVQVIY